MKQKLTLLLIALFTTVGAWAQRTVTIGSQITSEGSIVSGRAYVLKTGNAYISDNGSNYDVLNSGSTSTERTVYYLYDNGDGTWKIKNYFTNKYWSAPTTIGENITSVEEASAGSWSLNFSSDVAYPSAMGTEIKLGLERSSQKMQGWADGSGNLSTGANAKVYIYEVGYYDTIEDTELKGKMITVGDAVSSITTNTWYVIKCNTPQDAGYYRGSIFENSGALYHNGNTSRDRTVKWLFKFEEAGETDMYYVKTAYGNYFTDFTDNAQISTRTAINGKQKITVAKINSTDGHFYFKSNTSGVIMDANGLASGVASGNVVGWTTTAPETTGGNNDWGIYEVSITDIDPIASEIFTINNTNSDRGPIIYAPAKSTKWVWVSGKDGAKAFDANDANHQWIFYPTGTSGQYYLYNVGYQKFAIPVTGGTYAGYSWAFSDEAVAVTMTRQSNGTYKITSAKGNKYISISKSYTGPVINYNDAGAEFTLTKVADASSSVSTQLTAAVNKLVISQTALADAPTGTGWYAIRIKYNNSSLFGYVYTLPQETTNNTNSYPLGFYSECDQIPTIANAQYFVKLTKSYYGYYMQLPNGKYIQNGKPFSQLGESSMKIAYTNENHFTMGTTSDTYYFRPYNIDGYSPTTYFIGETGTAGSTYYDIYPINLTTAGLTAWTVSIAESTGTEKLVCSREDVSVLTSVYNNGYIFLPTGTTPTASDFSVTGIGYAPQIKINESAKTITVVNATALFATLKAATKFDILDESTVMGPSEFAAPESINAAIDAAQVVEDNAEAKVAFIESANGTMIKNYLDQVATYGALATVKITMNNEYGTMILPCPCTRIDGLAIYSCSAAEGNVLTLTPVDGDYAYNKPYIIHATAGNKYTIIGWDKGSTGTHTEGWLTGALNAETEIPSGSYMLATNKSTNVQAFYQVSGSGVLCAQNKCFLTVESPVKAFFFDGDDEATAIEELFGSEAQDGTIYNLAGQRISKMQKGINIVNGKKIMVK